MYYNPYNPMHHHHYPTQQRRIKIEEAMVIATNQIPGEIVKVELETEKGLLIYEVEIIAANGRKHEVEIDANTGNIVSIK